MEAVTLKIGKVVSLKVTKSSQIFSKNQIVKAEFIGTYQTWELGNVLKFKCIETGVNLEFFLNHTGKNEFSIVSETIAPKKITLTFPTETKLLLFHATLGHKLDKNCTVINPLTLQCPKVARVEKIIKQYGNNVKVTSIN